MLLYHRLSRDLLHLLFKSLVQLGLFPFEFAHGLLLPGVDWHSVVIVSGAHHVYFSHFSLELLGYHIELLLLHRLSNRLFFKQVWNM
jgi:hypothetical protein